MNERLTIDTCLSVDRDRALLIGRAWIPAAQAPAVVCIRGDHVCDLSRVAATTSALFELDNPLAAIRAARDLPPLAALEQTPPNSAGNRRHDGAPWFLAPCDLQAIKASGVTFISSMLERVIE